MTLQQFILGAVPPAPPVPYDTKVLALSPIAYWGLDDTAGTIAVEKVNGGAWNGTYVNTGGITLDEVGMGDGNPSVLFNPIGNENGNVAINSAGLSAGYNGDEGTIGIWIKPFDADTWLAGVSKRFFTLQVDFVDRIVLEITGNPANESRFMREANDSNVLSEDLPYSSLGWQHWMGRWSQSGNTQSLMYNGVQVSQESGLSVWTGGAFDSDVTRLGSFNASGTAEMNGWMAKAVIFDRWLDDPDALSVGSA